MIKETITYTDLNGVEHSEEHYFHLSKGELAKMELSGEGNSLTDQIQKMVEKQSGKDIINAFEDILHRAYGVRSEDGARFVKNEELWHEFYNSEAYSELFFKLVTDGEYGSKFVAGIIPSNLAEEVAKSQQSNAESSEGTNEPAKPKTPQEMSREELLQAFQEKAKQDPIVGPLLK